MGEEGKTYPENYICSFTFSSSKKLFISFLFPFTIQPENWQCSEQILKGKKFVK